jgi:molybdate transport system ATP-binding protein
VAVVGQRWEGKTTLLQLAAGMEIADAGEVCFEGRDFAVLSRGARAGLLGREIVWLDRQESGLGLRVLDYIGLPMVLGHQLQRGGERWFRRGRGEARRMALGALERVGVAHVAEKRPAALSTWERVLVGLARAVLVRPKLLVVDDLLDALGATRTQQASDLLRSLVAEFGFGVLLSVSDFEAALVADRVFAFERRGLRLMSSQTPTQADILPFQRGGVGPPDGSRGTRAC